MDQSPASYDWRSSPSRQLPPLDLHRSAAGPSWLVAPIPTFLSSEAPAGMIPCELDLKTGSTSEAEKRKSSSDASKRSRHRKKQAEEREKHMQDEIKRLKATIDHLTDENSSLRDQLARYQSRYFPSIANRPVQCYYFRHLTNRQIGCRILRSIQMSV